MTTAGAAGFRWQSDKRLRAWRLFLEAHTRVVRQMDDDLQAAHRLPIDWYDVLVQLIEAGGRHTMGNLASALLISPSNCSRLVDRLVTDGLVRREADPNDGRVKHAVLTDQGFEALKAASPTHLDGVEQYFTRFLGDDAVEPVLELFSQILGGLGYTPDATVEPVDHPGPLDAPGRGGGT